MPTGGQGSIRLFRFSGITVFLHWSWFLVAIYEIQSRSGRYSSITWNILEYLGLFLIVTMHEFGHALACRQVGGRANQIVLWPLGGVAYVDPPPRPGATLWSIAAGPLVNVALMPVFGFAMSQATSLGWRTSLPNAYLLIYTLSWINTRLFVFNILPIYPLDGGQILRSLLWFPLGRARSLLVSTVLGLLGVVAFVAWALIERNAFLGAIAAFMLLNCWGGFKHAQALLRLAKLPRREGYVCPTCKSSPPVGTYWKCAHCGTPFDTFQTGAVCPNCRFQYPATQCLDCGRQAPLSGWASSTLDASHLVIDSNVGSIK
jgi:Zn-dependent protease